MASSPITSRQIEGEKVEAVTDFLFLGSKITADGDCMKLEDDCFLQESFDNIFADILRAALSQHHVLGFEIVQLEFHHLY